MLKKQNIKQVIFFRFEEDYKYNSFGTSFIIGPLRTQILYIIFNCDHANEGTYEDIWTSNKINCPYKWTSNRTKMKIIGHA